MVYKVQKVTAAECWSVFIIGLWESSLHLEKVWLWFTKCRRSLRLSAGLSLSLGSGRVVFIWKRSGYGLQSAEGYCG